MNYNLHINLNKINKINDLLAKFSFIYNLTVKDSICITVDIPHYVCPEYLAIIVTIIKYIKYKCIKLHINVNNENNTYASRINFYKELGIDHEENFMRHDSQGRFVEITNFDEHNDVDIANNIMKVIKNNFNLEETTLKALSYTFFEIIGNVYQHATSPIGGYTVVQNYSLTGELRVIVLDAGIGIRKSLTTNKKYLSLTEEECLRNCIKESITNGSGAGNGLYHTTKFIENNDGTLKIYSGDHCLCVNSGGVSVNTSPHWQGTLVYAKINNNNQTDLSIFGEEPPTSITDFEDMLNGWDGL